MSSFDLKGTQAKSDIANQFAVHNFKLVVVVLQSSMINTKGDARAFQFGYII